MGQRAIDKRRDPRAFFALEEGIPILVRSRQDGAAAVRASLLSLSRSGMSFCVPRERLNDLRDGAELEIEPLELPGFTGSLPGLAAEVRYVLDFDVFARLSIGCEFSDLDSDTAAAIARYVNDRLRVLDEETGVIEPLD